MKDFLFTALSWVLIALPLAVLTVNIRALTEKQSGEQLAVGTGLGLLLGVALNSCGLWASHVLGFTIGPLWGMALATLYRRTTPSQDDNDPNSHR